MEYDNGRKKRDLKPTSIRISQTADDVWERLSDYLGISKQAVVELALRRLARQEGIPVPGDEDVTKPGPK
jgi:antitoxin component of RelBE/YafQ-DinJ toxin-antitoxin module